MPNYVIADGSLVITPTEGGEPVQTINLTGGTLNLTIQEPEPEPDPDPDPDPDPEPGLAWAPQSLTERLWTNWKADDLPDGPVAAWPGHSYTTTCTQDDTALQPVKTGDYVHFDSGDNLRIPYQSRGGTAHKAMFMLFRVNSGTGNLMNYNGFNTGARYRQPAVSLGVDTITVHWADDGGQTDLTLPFTHGDWHSLVTRRENGAYFASIDGGAEVSLTSDFVPSTSKDTTHGRLGYDIDWDLDEVATIQLGLFPDEVNKLHGWAAHKRGVALPAGHPYETAAPLTEGTDWQSTYQETSLEDWEAVRAFIGDNALAEGHMGEALDLTGWTLDFEDDFSTFSVAEQTSALSSNWYAAVHTAGAGAANVVRLGVTPPFYVQGDNELILRMAYQQVNGGGGVAHWYGSVITSVNLAGHGRTWTPPYYMECRMRNRAAYEGGWSAMWTESINYLTMQTEPYDEIDICEQYSGDPTGYHCVLHRHDPVRNFPGLNRLDNDSHKSNIIRLNSSKPWGDTNLWDDEYHVYGMMLEDDWTRIFFDGMEITRWPTTVETKAPQFILFDMALFGDQSATTGTPTVDPETGEVSYPRGPDDNQIGIDYCRVYTR